jgi:hypothetical protein
MVPWITYHHDVAHANATPTTYGGQAFTRGVRGRHRGALHLNAAKKQGKEP